MYCHSWPTTGFQPAVTWNSPLPFHWRASSVEICKLASQLEITWWSREKKLQILQLICLHLPRRSHVRRQIRLYRKAAKECLLQWKAPLYKSQFPVSLLRQDAGAWSRCQGGQESPSNEKSLKRNKRDTAQEKVESPCRWLRATETISRQLQYHLKTYKE